MLKSEMIMFCTHSRISKINIHSFIHKRLYCIHDKILPYARRTALNNIIHLLRLVLFARLT